MRGRIRHNGRDYEVEINSSSGGWDGCIPDVIAVPFIVFIIQVSFLGMVLQTTSFSGYLATWFLCAVFPSIMSITIAVGGRLRGAYLLSPGTWLLLLIALFPFIAAAFHTSIVIEILYIIEVAATGAIGGTILFLGYMLLSFIAASEDVLMWVGIISVIAISIANGILFNMLLKKLPFVRSY